jgi:hypothetical protein
MDEPGWLDKIFSLSREYILEVETHPANSKEHRIRAGGELFSRLGCVRIVAFASLPVSAPVMAKSRGEGEGAWQARGFAERRRGKVAPALFICPETDFVGALPAEGRGHRLQFWDGRESNRNMLLEFSAFKRNELTQFNCWLCGPRATR